MAANTKIEWAANADGTPGATWNPIRARDRETGLTGTFCVRASDGCRNCYAEVFQGRKLPGNGLGLAYTAQNLPRVENFIDERMLAIPLRRRKPTTYFLSSMTDVFGEWVSDMMLDRLFAVMALCPHHVFIVVTKRAERMRRYMEALTADRFRLMPLDVPSNSTKHPVEPMLAMIDAEALMRRWPLPNVCLMVSAEDQRNADARIPDLLATPARWRGVSIEPMIGAVSLAGCKGGTQWIGGQRGHGGLHRHYGDSTGHDHGPTTSRHVGDPRQLHHHHDERCGPGLDWVICGGESQDGARPMHPDWARTLRDQCADAGVPFFFKQWGEWVTVYDRDHDDPDWSRCSDIAAETPKGQWLNLAGGQGFHGDRVVRVSRIGKANAGRLLHGIEHNARPDFTVRA